MKIDILKSTLTFVASVVFTVVSIQLVQAKELNLPGFTGSINSTVSSGISMRVSERDCRLLAGWSYTPGGIHSTLAGEGGATVATLAGTVAARGAAAGAGNTANLLRSYDSTGNGCGGPTADTYGNTTDNLFDFGNDNANDGNENFGQGDIFSATQKVYSEITGTTDDGVGVNISFIGSYNPALDLSSPAFKAFTSEAKDEFQSNVELLNAYVTTSYDAGDTYVDVTAGRFVTSWGESTFIPIGMNGLVTNSLDLTKLRSPGASIKEALMPTEQLTLGFGMSDGSTIEVYGQFGHDPVGLDVRGSYFGSEIFGAGAKSLDGSGTFANEREAPVACPWALTGSASHAAAGFATGAGLACSDAVAAATSQHATNWTTYNTSQLVVDGLQAMGAQELAWADLVGSTHEFTAGQDGLGGSDAASAGNLAQSAASTFITSGMTVTVDSQRVATAYAGIADAQYTQSATVDLNRARTGLMQLPSDSGQYGIRWGKYFDDIGTGLDVGAYYANYHSKVPYIQFKMPGNVFASDILGAYLLAQADYNGTDLSALGVTTNVAGTYDLASAAGVTSSGANGMAQLHMALGNAAASSGLCDAVLGGALRTAMAYDGTNTRGFIDGLVQQAMFGVAFESGEVYHNDALCMATASGDGSASAATTALIGTGARLFAAVTPINMIEYQGIFPEDLQIMGASFNTNIGATTIQGEVAYRPAFPLATGAGDQVAQLNDKNGSHDALAMVAIGGVDAVAAANVAGHIATITALGGNYYNLINAHERSTLGNVWDANGNATTDLTASNYYSKPYIEYDVWSGTFGTTTSFQASHPVTVTLGADASYFLTEVGFVKVAGMDDNANGYVSRNGFNEGAPAGTTKCLGTFVDFQAAMVAAGGVAAALAPSYTTLASAGSALTNIGTGVVDALFGNGGYCEDNPGADDFAMTYRLLGGATYNNVNNSSWTLSPNISVAHDFMGYAPSSLGGFAEDRFTVSVGASLTKGSLSVSGSYVDYMDLGDNYSQLETDKDYLSMSVSYAF